LVDSWVLWFVQVQIRKDNGKTAVVPAYQSLETIAGEVVPNADGCVCLLLLACEAACRIKLLWNWCLQVSVAPVPGKRLEHTGVKIELLGQIGTDFASPTMSFSLL
jgi:vacuolar protein sorting-associated protein 26